MPVRMADPTEAPRVWSRSCTRCLAAGQRPPGFGSDRKCAFETGTFDTNNWQCESIAALMTGSDDGDLVWTDDQSVLVVPLNQGGCFAVLGRYKHRGRLEVAVFIYGETVRPLTLEDIEQHLAAVPNTLKVIYYKRQKSDTAPMGDE